MLSDELDQALADLYRLPLKDFTAARNRLAKELRAEGDKAAAAEIARLAKLPITPWTVNRLTAVDQEVLFYIASSPQTSCSFREGPPVGTSVRIAIQRHFRNSLGTSCRPSQTSRPWSAAIASAVA